MLQNNERGFLLIFAITVAEYNKKKFTAGCPAQKKCSLTKECY
jgi:hypothetical protein